MSASDPYRMAERDPERVLGRIMGGRLAKSGLIPPTTISLRIDVAGTDACKGEALPILTLTVPMTEGMFRAMLDERLDDDPRNDYELPILHGPAFLEVCRELAHDAASGPRMCYRPISDSRNPKWPDGAAACTRPHGHDGDCAQGPA